MIIVLLKYIIRKIRYIHYIVQIENKYKVSISYNSNLTGHKENIYIGENTRINNGANFRFKKGKIHIGKNVRIAQNVSLLAGSYSLQKGNRFKSIEGFIKIGDNVWLGANVVIMPNVIIGANSVVGSNSVVTKDIPENEVWAGVPARFIRHL